MAAGRRPTQASPLFDMTALCDAVDAKRRAEGLDWYPLAQVLWEQSARLNDVLEDHPLCGGALSRVRSRGATSCQYALYLLRWLGRPPEDFLTAAPSPSTVAPLPAATSAQRLRFDLPVLHDALNVRRRQAGLTWAALAGDLGCTANRLTNLRTAREADLDLTVRVTQWLGRPSSDFIRPMDASDLAPEHCSG